jgi:hypothetical protein
MLHAPAHRGGIRRASQTKINNLGTDEYASNLPFSKIWPHFGGNDGFKKIENLEFLKNYFKFRNSCEKTFSNNLVFEPMEHLPHE